MTSINMNPKNKHPLAYGRVIDKIKLPEQYHKGKKLLDAQRQEVRKLYQQGGYSYRSLAKRYNVAYGVIQAIISPTGKQRQAEAGKRWRQRTNYKADYSNQKGMEIRRRKKALILAGIIKLQ